MKNLALIVLLFLSSCFVYEGTYTTAQTKPHTCELMERGQACLSDHSCCEDPNTQISYWRINYAPTVGLYYYNQLPYWGYHSGYYYYYGYQHIYPWWYYYNFLPPYYYNTSTHVHCHIGTHGYVYRPRGNWRHNNKKHFTYHHDKIHNTGIKVENYSNVPTKWKNNVKTNIKNNSRTNTNIKTNKSNITPKININKSNNNRSNTKTNINKNNKINNSKTNRNKSNNRSNTKIQINKSNNKSINRQNTNRKPK